MNNTDISRIVAIDPDNCGCTECMIGLYVPSNHYSIEEVLEAVLNDVIDPQSNVGSSMLVWRTPSGPMSEKTYGLTRSSDTLIVSPDEYYGDDDEAAEKIDVSKLDDMDDDEKLEEILKQFLDGAPVKNTSDDYYFVWSNYGSYSITELNAYVPDSLKILWD